MTNNIHVMSATGGNDGTGERWKLTLTTWERSAGLAAIVGNRIRPVDPRTVPMHVLEALAAFAHAGLNPDTDDDNTVEPPAIEDDAGFYCVTCGHDAHSPHRCACGCLAMQEATR